ncbi:MULTISPECIES: restriction endonuclease subunit S [unclassified Pseudomonas]|uniref:restriction endonuclease subunit S n=1 Tax=unclassified Pseudomonas TaxID=196821 RepID=UPI00104CE144|nr:MULTISPECIES: restriction endonuclease subunit S [unclassified Pseudomonas]
MELKPGYKQTEVGVIPEDWRNLPITKVARLESGHTPSKRNSNYWGGGVNWISLFDTQGLSRNEISTTEKTITAEGLNNSSARLLPAGTVVFSRTATVGKVSIMATSMATSQDFANYICGPGLHNIFLVYLFRSMGRTWKTLMAGSIHNTIYMPTFKALKIVVPPLSEQKAIAQALSDTDVLIESLDQLLTKKRQIKQGTMQELLTGQRRLPGFSGGWKKKRLAQLADIRSGGTPSTSQSEYWDGDILWCTPTDITGLNGHKYLSDTNRKITSLGLSVSSTELIPENSIVMTSRATIGECAINLLPLCTNQGFKNFIPFDGVDIEFLYYLLSAQKQKFISLCGGSTFLEIGKSQLAIYEVRVPELKEQTAIATILSAMDEGIVTLETQLQKARHLKQGMMQELLTGRIRLV